ncbi:MIP18 family protein galla-2-like [Zophobas morio]|uniref:MIP18 family protein galla-2-like n=1 Tax=Zophobas morio TaxID=2755281 RepID=UPI003082A88C
MALENASPLVYQVSEERKITPSELDESVRDPFDSREVFDLIRKISDPEHPMTLEQLNVVRQSQIKVEDENNKVDITFTPTIEHCSMATLIGLSIRVQLLRTLPSRFKVNITCHPKSHRTEDAINKQLADKERVSAALENHHILEVINRSLLTTLPSNKVKANEFLS